MQTQLNITHWTLNDRTGHHLETRHRLATGIFLMPKCQTSQIWHFWKKAVKILAWHLGTFHLPWQLILTPVISHGGD